MPIQVNLVYVIFLNLCLVYEVYMFSKRIRNKNGYYYNMGSSSSRSGDKRGLSFCCSRSGYSNEYWSRSGNKSWHVEGVGVQISASGYFGRSLSFSGIRNYWTCLSGI